MAERLDPMKSNPALDRQIHADHIARVKKLAEIDRLRAELASLRQQLAASQAREAEAYERAIGVAEAVRIKAAEDYDDDDNDYAGGEYHAAARIIRGIRALTGEVDDAR